MSRLPIAVVAGHGDFAQGMITAVAQITGRDDLFVPFTNRDLCGTDIEAALRALVETLDVRAIFTDLPAGSCAIAAQRVLRARPDLVVVTGVNLPLLLQVAMRPDAAVREAAEEALDRSRQAVRLVTGPPRGD